MLLSESFIIVVDYRGCHIGDHDVILNMATEDREGSAAVAAVSLKLSPFWPADPDVWFAQVEAQFSTRGITSQRTKYDYVVASLSAEFAAEVRYLILHVPEDPYDTLRQQLIQRTCQPEQRRLQLLFSATELGDRKPSQLLRRMRQLLGDTPTDSDGRLLRELFLQRLPSNVRVVLAFVDADRTLEEIAQLADKIVDIAPSTVSALTPSTAVGDAIDSLRSEVDRLTRLVSTLARERSPQTSRPRSSPSLRHVQRRSRTPPPSAGLCWYHTRFGDKARNCTPPCSRSGNAPASR